MKDKFVFRYDKDTKKGILITEKGEFEINLQKKAEAEPVSERSGSGSNGGGYGLHLI